MPKYLIAVSWQVDASIEIEASSLEEANLLSKKLKPEDFQKGIVCQDALNIDEVMLVED